MKIVILGVAHPFRGGLAAFNERLAVQLQSEGHQVDIFTFSLQYPNILFPGKTQYADWEAPKDVSIKICVNSINPLNWIKVGRRIKKSKPDLLIIKYWMPFMSPCFGTIARIAKANGHTKVLSIVDNMIPHEKHFYDSVLSKYFVKSVDAFLAMSQSVLEDINTFDKSKPKILSPHPMFDNFGTAVSREEALSNLALPSDVHYLLFFGFIRNYKGLDWLLEAFADARLREFPVKLMIAGEFYEDDKKYIDIIKRNRLEDRVILKSDFIPDAEVVNYFCAADLVVQPYKDATQSGVTQIGYHFSKPMLVTNVGGLAEIIPEGKAGYVVEPKVEAIADALVDFLKYDKRHFFDSGIADERKKYRWNEMTAAIVKLLNS